MTAPTTVAAPPTTTADRSVLAQPLTLPNGFVIPNRLAKAALSEGLGDRDGSPGARIQSLHHRHAEALLSWARMAKYGGSMAWVQINHPGRQTPRTLTPHSVAPSALALPGSAKLFGKPRELSTREIVDLICRFATTSTSAAMLGVDETLKESTRRREAYFLAYAEKVRAARPELR